MFIPRRLLPALPASVGQIVSERAWPTREPRAESKSQARTSRVEWRKIAGLRDILIHHYFGIDVGIIWDVVQNKLPAFERQVRAILDSLADG